MNKQTTGQGLDELEQGITAALNESLEEARAEGQAKLASAHIRRVEHSEAKERGAIHVMVANPALSEQTPTPMGPKKRVRAAERVARAERLAKSLSEGEHTGGSVNYYKLTVEHPTHAKKPYTVECNDVIEALGMDFAEGNVFKALWRTAAARQGKLKRGHDAVYDAEKIVFFGQRLLERARRYLAK